MGLEEADRLGTETVDRVRRHFCVTSSVHQQHAELGAGKFICRRPELQCWDGRNAGKFYPTRKGDGTMEMISLEKELKENSYP